MTRDDASTEPVLRVAVPEDAVSIAIIHRAAWAEMILGHIPDYEVLDLKPGRWPEKWGKALAAPPTPCEGVAVLETGEGLQGVAWMGPFKNSGPGIEDRAFLRRLFIPPAAQGRGYGSRLLNWAEATAREGGARQIELWCLEVNTAARDFYLARGYKADGTEGTYNREGRPLRKFRYRKRF